MTTHKSQQKSVFLLPLYRGHEVWEDIWYQPNFVVLNFCLERPNSTELNSTPRWTEPDANFQYDQLTLSSMSAAYIYSHKLVLETRTIRLAVRYLDHSDIQCSTGIKDQRLAGISMHLRSIVFYTKFHLCPDGVHTLSDISTQLGYALMTI